MMKVFLGFLYSIVTLYAGDMVTVMGPDGAPTCFKNIQLSGFYSGIPLGDERPLFEEDGTTPKLGGDGAQLHGRLPVAGILPSVTPQIPVLHNYFPTSSTRVIYGAKEQLQPELLELLQRVFCIHFGAAHEFFISVQRRYSFQESVLPADCRTIDLGNLRPHYGIMTDLLPGDPRIPTYNRGVLFNSAKIVSLTEHPLGLQIGDMCLVAHDGVLSPDNLKLAGNLNQALLFFSYFSVVGGAKYITLHYVPTLEQQERIDSALIGQLPRTVMDLSGVLMAECGADSCVQMVCDLISGRVPELLMERLVLTEPQDYFKEPVEINFSSPSLSPAINRVEGLSGPEAWGRWSDGNVYEPSEVPGQIKIVGERKEVNFILAQPLHDHFTLTLEGRALGDNAGQPIIVRVGSKQFSIMAQAEFNESLEIVLEGEECNVITFIMPNPQLPGNGDPRKLAIGFQKLGIR